MNRGPSYFHYIYYHGVLKNRSISTNITIVTIFTVTELDIREKEDVICTDFSKASDLVDHHISLVILNFSKGTFKLLVFNLWSHKQAIIFNIYL